jgi:Tfp pilus assembly protein PilO
VTKIRRWSLLTAVVAALVLVAGWFLVVHPKRSDAAALREQADQQRSANAALSQRIQMLRAQAKDLPAVKAKLAAISAKIPDNPSLPSLIRTLSAVADDAGVDLVSIAPSQPAAITPAAPTTPSPAPAPTPTSSPEPSGSASSAPTPPPSTAPSSALSQLPVTVQVTGSYATLEQFFAGVETMKRAMLVTGFTLAPGGGSGGSGSDSGSGASAGSGTAKSGQLTANLTARVFVSQAAASSSGGEPSSAAAPSPSANSGEGAPS